MSDRPYPHCPRCGLLVDSSMPRLVSDAHLWHSKCHAAFMRDREWLTRAEAEAHFA